MTVPMASRSRSYNGEYTTPWAAGGNIILRLQGVALHLLATYVLAKTLSLYDTGLFFWGLVITVAGATFMRAKFDLYLGRYVVAGCDRATGIAASDVLLYVARRFLRRCVLICTVLLVVVADLDVMFQNLHHYLETFVPFVLALPFVGLAGMIAAMLQSANRFLLGMICTVFAINGAVLTAFVLNDGYGSLLLYSWSFFGGSVFGAALALLFARHVFGPLSPREQRQSQAVEGMCRQIDCRIEDEAGIPFAATLLLWGPPCLLIILAPAQEMAQFAVALRSAQVICYLMPALAFLLMPRGRRHPYQHFGGAAGSAALLRSLSGMAGASAILAVVLLLAAPALLHYYGVAYAGAYGLYLVLVIAQAVQMASRPALRYLTVNWNPAMLRRAQVFGGAVAVVICLGIPMQGAMSAALATLAGFAVTAAIALAAALRQAPFADVHPQAH